MTGEYGSSELLPSRESSLAAVALVCAMACTDPTAARPATADDLAVSAPRALSVNTVTDLGWGGAMLASHFALGINASFTTVGTATNTAGERRAVRASNGSSATNEMGESGELGAAYAVAGDGSAVGYVAVAGFGSRGFIYNTSNNGQPGYSTIDTARRGVVNDINDGIGGTTFLVGWIETAPNSGDMRSLDDESLWLNPNLAGGSWSVATKISNDPVRYVGYGEVAGGAVRAWIVNSAPSSSPATPVQLTRPSGCTNSVAWSINDHVSTPTVVGYCDDALGRIRAVKWVGNVVTDLGDLGGGNSVAVDVNNSGDIVGYAMITTGSWRPFIVRAGSAAMDELASLGSGSTWGVAIALTNRAADGSVRVVGYAEDPNSVDRARPVSWTVN